MQALIVAKAKIDYPIEARWVGISGSGVFEMRINPRTGRVKGVFVVQSAGSQILNWTVVRSLSRWRFKRGTIVAARIPVAFTLRRSW